MGFSGGPPFRGNEFTLSNPLPRPFRTEQTRWKKQLAPPYHQHTCALHGNISLRGGEKGHGKRKSHTKKKRVERKGERVEKCERESGGGY